MLLVFFFFFKQKTAYELTYGDWSSDVCSSDLTGRGFGVGRPCRRETSKALRWPNPRQDRRHGADRRSALARALRAERDGHEHVDGTQANRQMEGREGSALHRVRE